MKIKNPAFIDCYGDLKSRVSSEMLNIVPDLEIFYDKPADENELIKRLQGRRNVMVYMAYLSSKVLKACPQLKTISYLSTGLATHGDLTAAEEMDIRFEGVKGYGDRAVAEHTIALAFAAIKQITKMDRMIKAGNWGLLKTEELQGKTFGIIGLGGIGLETAKIAKALGTRTIGWSRSASSANLPVEIVTLDHLLTQSDIISLHLPLTRDTKAFIDTRKLKKTKKGVILINTARADIVDEDALISFLESGHIGQCSLAVFHREPLETCNPLIKMNNVTLTPHSAWLTTQAIDRLLLSGFSLLKKQISETSYV